MTHKLFLCIFFALLFHIINYKNELKEHNFSFVFVKKIFFAVPVIEPRGVLPPCYTPSPIFYTSF